MSFLVFDIETRVDKTLLRAVQFRGEPIGEEAAYERMRDDLRRSGGRGEFFPLSFHTPIAIGFAEVDDGHVLREVEVLGADTLGEAGLVTEFWRRLEAFEGVLVSFNGRGFDLPVLELHALRHGCAAPRYCGDRNGLRGRSPRHCDLYEWLTSGGSRLRGGLDLVARIVGLPGKGEVSGGDVQVLWERGRWADIRRYCRDDVLQTYFVLLRIAHFRGQIDGDRLRSVEAAAASFRAELDRRSG
jgi:predicted PolB exonuclease-like 3'-5' exonuclease